MGEEKYNESIDPATLMPRAEYVRVLRRDLPVRAFERALSRLAFVPVHIAVITIATFAIALGWMPWFIVPLSSLAIGGSFAGLTFIAHEVMHGGIVRSKRWQYAIAFLGFLPFTVSPRLWSAWHNTSHHARANQDDDPDAYPTLEAYRAHARARFAVDSFSLGGGRLRGLLSLVLGFTVQSAGQLAFARSSGTLTARQHRRAIVETLVAVAFWSMIGALVGFVPFLFVFAVPLLVANVCVMAFILTNHSLSQRVSINDPLVASLTVTTPRLVSWLTLGFGFHVEHHLFPAMSTRHAGIVRDHLKARWPERYRSMPLLSALGRLYHGARVYKTATLLCDPRTGAEHATL